MRLKRLLSALLTTVMVFTMLAATPVVSSASDVVDFVIISSTNPVITADVGDTVDLSCYVPEAVGDNYIKHGYVTWKQGDTVVETLEISEKGVLELVASFGNSTQKVYVVSKYPEEREYVLYENDFNCTAEDLKAEGWNFLNAGSVTVTDGVFHMGTKSGDYYRAILPAWLGDFGDYAITMKANQTDVKDNSRWCSIAYRIENANKYYYPYYHMCVRANTTSSTVEFAERTPANAWNVVYKASEKLNMTDKGFHEITVKAFENTVQYLIDGKSVMFVGDANAHKKGYVGLICNYGTMNVDSIRITVQETAPERPPVVPKLVDTSVNRTETNITNYVSNHAYVTPTTMNAMLGKDVLPAGALLDLTGQKITQSQFEEYLEKFTDKNIIPQFKLDTKDQVDALNNAIKATKVPETLVVSADPAVLKHARTRNKAVIRGALDLTDENALRLSDEEIHAYYDSAAGAYAQALIVPYHLATKENVAKWQEYELAVWAFGTGIETDSQAAWLVASGANAIVSDNCALIAEVQTKYFTAKDSLTRTPVWTAHRGYSSKYPENSLAACQGAYEAGADCLEIDVHLSSDGVVMVMHDETIDRTTNGSGKIANMTYEQLKKYKLKHNGKVTEESIPTFEELLKAFQGKDIKFLCEIKSSQSKLPKACVDLIKKYGMEDQVVFISFNANQLTLAKQYMNVSTGYLLNAIGFTDAGDTLGTLNAYYEKQTDTLNYHATMAINYGNLTSEFLRDANDRGVTLWTWTYSNSIAEQVCKMFKAGVNGMTTNDPQYLQNSLKTISAPQTVLVAPGSTGSYTVESLTYNGAVKDITEGAKVIWLENNGIAKISTNGTVTALKNGTATFMVAYQTKLPNNSTYTLYSQPITVKVGEIKELTLNSESDYTLANGILGNVKDNTSVADLLKNFAGAEEIQVYNASGKLLTSKDKVGTGAKIVYNDTETLLIVKGDLTGDGKINSADYAMLKRSVLKTYTLNDTQKLAANVNDDSRINSSDYAMLKRHVLKTFNIFD